MEKPYVPSPKEFKKAGDKMTGEEKKASEQRERKIELEMPYDELLAKKEKDRDMESAIKEIEYKKLLHSKPLIKILDSLKYWRNEKKSLQENLDFWKGDLGRRYKQLQDEKGADWVKDEIRKVNNNITASERGLTEAVDVIKKYELELKRRRVKE